MSLRLVESPASEPVENPKRTRAYKLPLLTEMSPEEQRDYVVEAHDAILAARLPHHPELTVKDALLKLPQLILTQKEPPGYGATEPWRGALESDLRILGVQLAAPSSRQTRDLLAQAEATGIVPSREEQDRAIFAKRSDLAPLQVVAGETATPIGYATYQERGVKSELKAAQKPIKHYFDVVPYKIGLPLYHEQYKNLIDMAEVLDNYWPSQANEERARQERRESTKAIARVAADAPDAALARAHHAILNCAIGRGETVRDALRLAQRTEADDAAESLDERREVSRRLRTYAAILEDYGIWLTPDGVHAGEVHDPAKLLRRGAELRVLKPLEAELSGLKLSI